MSVMRAMLLLEEQMKEKRHSVGSCLLEDEGRARGVFNGGGEWTSSPSHPSFKHPFCLHTHTHTHSSTSHVTHRRRTQAF